MIGCVVTRYAIDALRLARLLLAMAQVSRFSRRQYCSRADFCRFCRRATFFTPLMHTRYVSVDMHGEAAADTLAGFDEWRLMRCCSGTRVGGYAVATSIRYVADDAAARRLRFCHFADAVISISRCRHADDFFSRLDANAAITIRRRFACLSLLILSHAMFCHHDGYAFACFALIFLMPPC